MIFDSKFFDAKTVNGLTQFSRKVAEDLFTNHESHNRVFLAYTYFLDKILSSAIRGHFSYSETCFKIKKGDFKTLKIVRNEFRSLGYKFDISIDRRSGRYTITILWKTEN